MPCFITTHSNSYVVVVGAKDPKLMRWEQWQVGLQEQAGRQPWRLPSNQPCATAIRTKLIYNNCWALLLDVFFSL
jgi:hypothetical protein